MLKRIKNKINQIKSSFWQAQTYYLWLGTALIISNQLGINVIY
jgi:hypothetical protein